MMTELELTPPLDEFDSDDSLNDELLTALAANRESTDVDNAAPLDNQDAPFLSSIGIASDELASVKAKPRKSDVLNLSKKRRQTKKAPNPRITTLLSWFGCLAILCSIASFVYLLAAPNSLSQAPPQQALAAAPERAVLEQQSVPVVPQENEITEAVANEEFVANEELATSDEPVINDELASNNEPVSNEGPTSNVELATDVELAANAVDSAEAPPPPQIYRKKISEVTIGERAVGANPQGANPEESDATIFERVKHCGYALCYQKENGTQCNINLLRPEDWLDYEIVQLRRKTDGKVLDDIDFLLLETAPFDFSGANDYDLEVWVELPEMGVVGWAKLMEIDDEIRVQPGAGNVVTGTFAHISDEVIDLQIEDQSKPIGCTASHPFWSVDREDFIDAGQLYEGERVQLYNGETKRVVQKLPRPGPQNVYNLEIYSEHVYHVTQDGVLVHNECHLHHTIPREVYNPRSGNKGILHHLKDEKEIKGVKGSPNRISLDADVHRELHRQGYNKLWKEKLTELAAHKSKKSAKDIKVPADYEVITVEDVLALRDEILAHYRRIIPNMP